MMIFQIRNTCSHGNGHMWPYRQSYRNTNNTYENKIVLNKEKLKQHLYGPELYKPRLCKDFFFCHFCALLLEFNEEVQLKRAQEVLATCRHLWACYYLLEAPKIALDIPYFILDLE